LRKAADINYFPRRRLRVASCLAVLSAWIAIFFSLPRPPATAHSFAYVHTRSDLHAADGVMRQITSVLRRSAHTRALIYAAARYAARIEVDSCRLLHGAQRERERERERDLHLHGRACTREISPLRSKRDRLSREISLMIFFLFTAFHIAARNERKSQRSRLAHCAQGGMNI